MNQFHKSENEANNIMHLTNEPLTTLLGFDLETHQI